jgi:hypothetical protein
MRLQHVLAAHQRSFTTDGVLLGLLQPRLRVRWMYGAPSHHQLHPELNRDRQVSAPKSFKWGEFRGFRASISDRGTFRLIFDILCMRN